MPATELREATAGLTVYAAADLAEVWAQVSTAAQAQEALTETLPALVLTYGAMGASMAAEWYDLERELAEVAGLFTAIPADVTEAGAEALAGWGSQPLYAAEPDWETAKTRIEGGLQRRVANVVRETVMESAIEDPAAAGWQRTGDGACAFCLMLIARGAVYSETTANFSSHDHCNCAAVPAWGGRPVPVRPYTPSARRISDADRARVREYLRAN